MTSRVHFSAILAATLATAFSTAGLVGCSKSPTSSAHEHTPSAVRSSGEPAALELLDQMLAAHGGLDRYRAFGGMQYTMIGFPLSEKTRMPNTSTVDLVTRWNRIEGQGYTVGFDGQSSWSMPVATASGVPTRLYVLGSFYYMGMPWVFADSGVTLKDGGIRNYRSRTYRILRASYATGTGYSDADDYELFIDSTTKRLALIDHSVTEIKIERVTWEFADWHEVDGLCVPGKLVYREGFTPDPPSQGTVTEVRDVSFTNGRPSPSIFAPPPGAVVEH